MSWWKVKASVCLCFSSFLPQRVQGGSGGALRTGSLLQWSRGWEGKPPTEGGSFLGTALHLLQLRGMSLQ